MLEPRFIHANGLEIAYLEARPDDLASPLVLCLHGFPDTAWSFTDLLQRLAAAGYRAVAPFMRGYTPSALAPDGDYSIITLGRDVIALLEHFGADQGYVVGHDWGAAAAYAAAALRPDRVAGITVAGVPHLRRFFLRPSRDQLKASHYIFGFQLPRTPERRMARDDFAWLRDLVHSWSPNWEIPADYWSHLTQAFADLPRRQAALAYYRRIPRSLFSRELWRYLLQPVRVPALCIAGADDHCMLPQSFADQEHLFSAGYRFETIAGAGHFMHLEAPDAFAEAILGAVQAALPPLPQAASAG